MAPPFEIFGKETEIGLIDILVVRRNRLGDAAITCLVLRQLLSQYKNVRISVITNNYAAPIYREFLPQINVFEMPPTFWGIVYSSLFQSDIRKLRSKNFDLAINCSGSFSTKAIFTLLLFRANFKIAVGHPNRKLWSNFLDNALPLDVSLRGAHQIEKIVSLFRRANFDLSLPSPSIGKDIPIKSILLIPECNRKESTWHLLNWLKLRDKLVARGFSVALCGSRELAKCVDVEIFSPLNTLELIKLIESYDHIVSSEGGVSHLAALADKRITNISGVDIKRLWFPWSFDAKLIERTGDVDSITVEEIFEIIMRDTNSKNPSVFDLNFIKA